jgi:hypothetical protein
MWKLVTTAQESHCRPSQMLPWIAQLSELNPFVAYELDAAVATFGLVVKNALHETVEIGTGANKRRVARYTIHELLDDSFQFQSDNGLGVFRTMEGYSEVRE